MIPQTIIDKLGLQNVRQLNEFDIFNTQVADWETEIGRIKVMDSEKGLAAIREGCLYFMLHCNCGVAYVVATYEFITEYPEAIINDLKRHTDNP